MIPGEESSGTRHPQYQLVRHKVNHCFFACIQIYIFTPFYRFFVPKFESDAQRSLESFGVETVENANEVSSSIFFFFFPSATNTWSMTLPILLSSLALRTRTLPQG